jgi:hypothetical protein
MPCAIVDAARPDPWLPLSTKFFQQYPFPIQILLMGWRFNLIYNFDTLTGIQPNTFPG